MERLQHVRGRKERPCQPERGGVHQGHVPNLQEGCSLFISRFAFQPSVAVLIHVSSVLHQYNKHVCPRLKHSGQRKALPLNLLLCLLLTNKHISMFAARINLLTQQQDAHFYPPAAQKPAQSAPPPPPALPSTAPHCALRSASAGLRSRGGATPQLGAAPLSSAGLRLGWRATRPPVQSLG
eukprot:1158007-Pelagomonas_calceolata.AAC.3